MAAGQLFSALSGCQAPALIPAGKNPKRVPVHHRCWNRKTQASLALLANGWGEGNNKQSRGAV